MNARVIYVAVGMVITWPAQADESGVPHFVTCNGLYSDCMKRTTDNHAKEICSGYIIGIADALSVGTAIADVPRVTALLKDQDMRICRPPSITAGQTKDAVIKWLRDNPKFRTDAPAAAQVWKALIETWPCK
jgi:hypothetical protein